MDSATARLDGPPVLPRVENQVRQVAEEIPLGTPPQ
jgi:hypothetical protein